MKVVASYIVSPQETHIDDTDIHRSEKKYCSESESKYCSDSLNTCQKINSGSDSGGDSNNIHQNSMSKGVTVNSLNSSKNHNVKKRN